MLYHGIWIQQRFNGWLINYGTKSIPDNRSWFSTNTCLSWIVLKNIKRKKVFYVTIILSIYLISMFALLPFICSFNTLHYLIIISDLAVLILTYVVSQTSCVLSLTNFLFSLCYMFRFRKAVKAMFVLIPLFGVQLFVTIYRIPTSSPGGLEYERFSIVINNLQVWK